MFVKFSYVQFNFIKTRTNECTSQKKHKGQQHNQQGRGKKTHRHPPSPPPPPHPPRKGEGRRRVNFTASPFFLGGSALSSSQRFPFCFGGATILALFWVVLPSSPSVGWGCLELRSLFFCWVVLLGLFVLWVVLLFTVPLGWCCFSLHTLSGGVAWPPPTLGGTAFPSFLWVVGCCSSPLSGGAAFLLPPLSCVMVLSAPIGLVFFFAWRRRQDGRGDGSSTTEREVEAPPLNWTERNFR